MEKILKKGLLDFYQGVRYNYMEEINEWLAIGIEKGWVSEPFCHTHNGDPYMTEEEEREWEDGGDPCMTVVKILI